MLTLLVLLTGVGWGTNMGWNICLRTDKQLSISAPDVKQIFLYIENAFMNLSQK